MTYTATLDRITNEAKTLSPARIAGTLVTAPFFVIGWVVGLMFVAFGLVWSAVVVGFRSGRDVSPRRHTAVESGGTSGHFG